MLSGQKADVITTGTTVLYFKYLSNELLIFVCCLTFADTLLKDSH